MGRPTDWSPLAASDPLPGEPPTISDEARRLRDMATEMRSQISRLRAIGQDDALVGQYADKLRTAASDLAGKLEKTVGRYQQVSGELSSWAPELDHAQSESVRALEKARAAEAQRRANTVITAAPQPGDRPPTPAEIAAERRRQAALDEAARDLAAARRQLEDAVDHAHSRGRYHAERIREAIDDGVADSWWDNVKDWVDANAEWIKTVTKVLSWVATALAVVSLFIPGLNIVVAIAAGLTLAVLAGQTALAASGNGSWLDVGLSVFALATLGLGKIAASGLRGVQAATRAAGSRAANRAAQNASLRASAPLRNQARQIASRPYASPRLRNMSQEMDDLTTAQARQAGEHAARRVRDAPLADDYDDILAMRSQFPGDEGVRQASRNAELYRNMGRSQDRVGLAVDLSDKGASQVSPAYNQAKSHFKQEVGSSW